MNTTTTAHHTLASLRLRRLRGKMAIKELTVREISAASGVPYATASAILNGRINHPEYLARLISAVENAPMPELQAA